MSVSLLEVIEAGGFNPSTDPEDAKWLLSTQKEFDELVDQAEDFLEEIDRLEYEAELAQERADELRQAEREDPQPGGDFSGASEDPDFGGR